MGNKAPICSPYRHPHHSICGPSVLAVVKPKALVPPLPPVTIYIHLSGNPTGWTLKLIQNLTTSHSLHSCHCSVEPPSHLTRATTTEACFYQVPQFYPQQPLLPYSFSTPGSEWKTVHTLPQLNIFCAFPFRVGPKFLTDMPGHLERFCLSD